MVFLSGSGHFNGPVTQTAAGFVLFALITIIFVTLYLLYTVYCEKEYFSDAWEEKKGVSLQKLKDEEYEKEMERKSQLAEEQATTN